MISRTWRRRKSPVRKHCRLGSGIWSVAAAAACRIKIYFHPNRADAAKNVLNWKKCFTNVIHHRRHLLWDRWLRSVFYFEKRVYGARFEREYHHGLVRSTNTVPVVAVRVAPLERIRIYELLRANDMAQMETKPSFMLTCRSVANFVHSEHNSHSYPVPSGRRWSKGSGRWWGWSLSHNKDIMLSHISERKRYAFVHPARRNSGTIYAVLFMTLSRTQHSLARKYRKDDDSRRIHKCVRRDSIYCSLLWGENLVLHNAFWLSVVFWRTPTHVIPLEVEGHLARTTGWRNVNINIELSPPAKTDYTCWCGLCYLSVIVL